MASVFQKNGNWYAKWTAADGKSVRRKVPALTKTEAEQIANELQRMVDQSQLIPLGPKSYLEARAEGPRSATEVLPEVVYFVGESPARKIKIGRSSGCVWKRLSRLQTGAPRPLFLYAVWPCSNSTELERQLHRMFRDSRDQGEWFYLSPGLSDLIRSLARWGAPPKRKPYDPWEPPNVEDLRNAVNKIEMGDDIYALIPRARGG